MPIISILYDFILFKKFILNLTNIIAGVINRCLATNQYMVS